MERAVILARGTSIGAALLPLGTRREAAATTAAQGGAAPLIPLDELERRHIVAILGQTGFHKSRTAEILGISRKTLDRKIAEYGLTGDERP